MYLCKPNLGNTSNNNSEKEVALNESIPSLNPQASGTSCYYYAVTSATSVIQFNVYMLQLYTSTIFCL